MKKLRGGVILNYDDNPSRRTVEMCYRTNRTLVNPIIDWTDDDVWEFIRIFRIPYCGLYDDGLKRIGCIGCPLGGFASMRYELARWPTYRKLYVRAFDEMLVERKNNGKDDSTGLWTSGENVMLWWTGELQASDPNQMKMTDFTK